MLLNMLVSISYLLWIYTYNLHLNLTLPWNPTLTFHYQMMILHHHPLHQHATASVMLTRVPKMPLNLHLPINGMTPLKNQVLYVDICFSWEAILSIGKLTKRHE
jgi:hypothetical protein